MDIKIETRELAKDTHAVEVQGEIDVYTSPKVKEIVTELIDKGNNHLVINLEGVRYIDSTGLGVLIGALKKVREKEGSINLVCNNPQIKKIFNITGLVKIFGIYKNEEEALKNLKK
jgi:anti-sigma B factor antagonist